ncbi:PadR family transcriptional regulator [Actinomadura atramentaria]|uniref:PadR family transcriptional regulator n=1 Tax=Actinomadura atramentaria TaxID=1990 RepID=UPI00037C5137|nr:PadR family transcriptional regulator [Actinomadura atramentaria]
MSLRYAVLGLIAELEGASGYDLLKMFELSLDNVWPATQSQIYGELGKLTADGWIEVVGEGPRGRKAYAITPAGRAAMRHWLVDTVPAAPRRDEPMLRVFFLGQVDRAEAAEMLRRHEDAVRGAHAELAELDAQLEWDHDDLSFYGRLVMEYGKRLLAMRTEWAEWARAEIEADPRA